MHGSLVAEDGRWRPGLIRKDTAEVKDVRSQVMSKVPQTSWEDGFMFLSEFMYKGSNDFAAYDISVSPGEYVDHLIGLADTYPS